MLPIDIVGGDTFDEGVTTAAAVDEKLLDAWLPGFAAEFSPDEAEMAGAFEETALSERDALESAIDLANAVGSDGGDGK